MENLASNPSSGHARKRSTLATGSAVCAVLLGDDALEKTCQKKISRGHGQSSLDLSGSKHASYFEVQAKYLFLMSFQGKDVLICIIPKPL